MAKLRRNNSSSKEIEKLGLAVCYERCNEDICYTIRWLAIWYERYSKDMCYPVVLDDWQYNKKIHLGYLLFNHLTWLAVWYEISVIQNDTIIHVLSNYHWLIIFNSQIIGLICMMNSY